MSTNPDPIVSTQLLDNRIDAALERRVLHSGGGGPINPSVEARVGRLEEDMREVKGDLKAIIATLAEIKTGLATKPTTAQFWNMIGTVAVLALTVVTLVVGGVLGGLSFIVDQIR